MFALQAFSQRVLKSIDFSRPQKVSMELHSAWHRIRRLWSGPDETDTAAEEQKVRPSHPLGHFYSPIVDPSELSAIEQRIWPECDPPLAGIDLNEANHEYVLNVLFPQYFGKFDYPEAGTPDETLETFYVRNSQFSWLDARLLFVLLLAWQPRRIVEVGSGFSTLLMSDVASRFLKQKTTITAIEPYPRAFLKRLPVTLCASQVQDVPLEIFEGLIAGDILFIDSSHVAKTGSDVNYLFFEILPRLPVGVRIHFHDIFLPREYPKHWVLTENRSWNEQYVLRSLLMFSSRFKVVFGSHNAFLNHKGALSYALGLPKEKLYGGGSFWIEVV